MRAIVCEKLGDIDDLAFGEIAPPPLFRTGVRIAVRAAGLNFADTLIIRGQYQIKPPVPFSPGFEVAGEVIEIGADVVRCQVGDRVMAVVDHGGFAEEVVTDERQVFRLAATIDYVTAAAVPVAYGTSHLGLWYKAALRAGEWLLVHGAAGGVGLTAVEVAKIMDARVIATASSPEKRDIARAAGADWVLDSAAQDLREQVKEITGGRGVDVVYDPVGGELFDQSLRCTAQGGRILIVGFASGTVPRIPANILLVKNIAAIGFYWGAHSRIAPGPMEESCRQLVDWLARGRLKPHVSATYPLAEARSALHALKARRTTGKVVLTVAD